ncbi:ABC transporter ATP-binding protein [Ponticoccus alexandrii]|uniref:ATP-binding cassette domain-containing protein n=1 Tax=Ponticoccus alexandrii TaxID=1943633 RepID=A0ABX7F8Y3_9RHOB|nr:ABC transporter ATP-binding protein [Ponticoccus alexandrii]ETA51694.1 peptide ABC transporter ATP-binding protein [Rhodobacteraceae bacterium PD-2]QRF66584.1 ATP-binding cassette domain-containing protein [Ponticoccus alexandrii]
MTLLDVQDLSVTFDTPRGPLHAASGVSFSVARDETVAIVGESGCGKSVTVSAITGMLDAANARISGVVLHDGADVLTATAREQRGRLGRAIGMIFQNPMTSLNPVLSIGYQLTEPLKLHTALSRRERRAWAIDLLRQVGLSDPEKRLGQYPHELSGGMRQRVTIAIALACDPELIIADEPTTALDVTVQAQILDLLRALRRERGSSMVMITHDLGVVAALADRVVVMYAGHVVETAPVAALFAAPAHPYTAALMRAVPDPTDPRERDGAPLHHVPGQVPDLARLPQGCPFQPRCDRAVAACVQTMPPAMEISPGQYAACHNPCTEARA